MTVTLTVGTGKTYSNIQLAVDAVPASRTEPYIIDVYSGTYTSYVAVYNKSGSATNTLTIKQAAGESVTLVAANWYYRFFEFSNSNYVIISGFISIACS